MNNLKKRIAYIGAGAIALTLAGCSETAQPTENSGNVNPTETSDMTLEELFAKTTEASDEANSFHIDMVTNQTMEMGPGMSMEMKMDLAMDMTLEPMAFYQTGETSFVSEDTEGMEDMPIMEMESYFTDEGMYTYDPMMDMWVKLPAEDMEDLHMMMDQPSGDLSSQLEQLKAFRDDFTFEQSGDEFILKLDASGEKYQELIFEQMGQMPSDMELGAKEVMEAMTINKVYYEIFIDKETFLPNTMNIDMDFDMEMEGESMSIQSGIESEYSNYNGIDEIIVPAEVVEKAQEI